MRKLLLFVAMTFGIMSCSKNTEPSMVYATFGYQMVEGHSMTKATSSAIRKSLESANPKTIKVTAVGQESGESIFSTGTEQGFYPDTYTFTADFIPDTRCNTSKGLLYSEPQPRIKINDSFTITKGTTSYTLNATYECFAIVVDKGTLKDIAVYNDTEYITCLSFITTYGDYDIVFVETSVSNLKVELIPKNEEDYNHAYYAMPKERKGKFFYGRCLLKSVYGTITPDFVEWGEGEWSNCEPVG